MKTSGSKKALKKVLGPEVPPLTDETPRYRLLIQQLILLLHSHACLKKEGTNHRQCKIRLCPQFKEVWSHIKTCGIGETCPERHCWSSIRIIVHWRTCRDLCCPVCQRLRDHGVLRTPAGNEDNMQGAGHSTCSQGLSLSECQGRMVRDDEPGNKNYPSTSSPSDTSLALSHSSIHRNSSSRDDYENDCSLCQCQWRNVQDYQTCNSDNSEDDFQFQENVLDEEQAEGKELVPSAEEIRIAYEQLGIPCPPDALKRLMATLPGGSSASENLSESD